MTEHSASLGRSRRHGHGAFAALAAATVIAACGGHFAGRSGSGAGPSAHPTQTAPPSGAYARLLHWAKCLRAHGISGLADPRAAPPPAPGSPETAGLGTLMGDGGYWIGIPTTIDAHSPAFERLSTACGESPNGPHP